MTSLYFDINENQWPLIYDEKYNVSVCGLEKFHVFDAKKWRNIIQYLKEADFITDDCLVKPKEAQKKDLRRVHTKRYLNSLKWSTRVAIIAEVPLVALLPNVCVQYAYLRPMRHNTLRLQTGGSVLAGKLALERGWAVNVGGGFHHCSGDRGGGFCPYADITLLIRCLLDGELIQNAMIVDLDAHQGNGYQRDFLGVPEVYIMDMYNKHIYPRDKAAKQAIRRKIELGHLVEDVEYMLKLKKHLKAALNEFTPDILVYNAGTDILDSDPLGNLSVSSAAIPLRRGVRQGDVISPKLFTNAMEDAFKLLEWHGFGININGEYITHLRFADDIVVMAETLEDLGTMLNDLNRVSQQGIIKRDEFVFETCKSQGIPIVMLTSGGYLRKTARIIADSIMNLHRKGLITGECPVTND